MAIIKWQRAEGLNDLYSSPVLCKRQGRLPVSCLSISQQAPDSGLCFPADLTWVQVRSAEEAWRVLRAGRRNQSFASTHLNQNSSRR